MQTLRSRRRPSLGMLTTLVALATIATACGSDETMAPEPSHTPSSAKLFVNDVDVSADLVLEAGALTVVEVRYYDDHGDEITGIEEHHYAGLAFTPGTLATAVAQADAHFFLDVTAQAGAGAGSVMVGYGHDEAADELTFGPFPVTVVVP